MALPVTITGISVDLATVGPFQSSAGNFYFFGRDASDATILRCMKATDPTDAWSSVDTQTGYSTSIYDFAGYQYGDVIHIVVADAGSPAGFKNYKYLTFNMAADEFVTSETVFSNANWSGTTVPLCDIVVRSDGTPVVVFSRYVSGDKIYYSRRIGTNNWSAAIEIDDGEAGYKYERVVGVLGDSDAIHCLYYSIGTAQRTYQRTLANDNTLLASTYISGANYVAQGISYDLGGVTKCVVVPDYGYVVYFDSGDTPSLNTAGGAWISGINESTLRIFEQNGVAYILYSKTVGTNKDYYFRSSTDGGANWSVESFICHSTNDGTTKSTSRFAKLFPLVDDIILPFLYVDAAGTELKYNHKAVATSAVNVNLPSINASAGCASVAKTIQKSAANISASAVMAAVQAPQVIIPIIKASCIGTFGPIVASGGDVSVNLQSVNFAINFSPFGLAKESAGGTGRSNITRLGPGGYPIAALPGGAGVAETSINLFAINAPTGISTFAGYQFELNIPAATSTAGSGIAVWQNKKTIAKVSTTSAISVLGKDIKPAVVPSATASAAAGQFGREQYVYVDGAITNGIISDFNIEGAVPFDAVIAVPSAGEFTPFAFAGTSVALNSVATQAVVEAATSLNESFLQTVSAYAANSIIRMEGDEALSLAAAAASGTVGDLLVAIVIPPAIQWLVCASIDIMPEVAGDLAMNAELQATVIAAAALQGSPQIGHEVDGALEIAPLISGSPSMKEC